MAASVRVGVSKLACVVWPLLTSTLVMAGSAPADIFVRGKASTGETARVVASSVPNALGPTIVLDTVDIGVQIAPFSSGDAFLEIRDEAGTTVLGTGLATWASPAAKTLSFFVRERPVLKTGERYRVYVKRSAGRGSIRWMGSCLNAEFDDYPFGRSSYLSNDKFDFAFRTFRFAGEGEVREDQFMFQTVKPCERGALSSLELDATGREPLWQEFVAGEQRMALTSSAFLIERNWTARGPNLVAALFRDGDAPELPNRVALGDGVAVSSEEVPEWHEVAFNTDRPLLEKGSRYRLYPGVLDASLPFPLNETTWHARAPDGTDYAGGESSLPNTDFLFQVSLNGGPSEPAQFAQSGSETRGVLHDFPQEWQSFTVRFEEPPHLLPDAFIGGQQPGSTSNFGEIGSTDVRTQTYSVRNFGTAPLMGVQLSLSGAQSDLFEIRQQPAATIAPGRSSVFQIRARPDGLGVKNALLTLASNDPDRGRYTVNLTVTGVPPVGPNLHVRRPDGTTLPPDGLYDFGSVFPGNSSSVNLTIKNDGTAPLNIARAEVTGGGNFAVTLPPAATVAPGATTTCTVTFFSGGGDVTATLNIQSNDQNPSLYKLALSGTSFD